MVTPRLVGQAAAARLRNLPSRASLDSSTPLAPDCSHLSMCFYPSSPPPFPSHLQPSPQMSNVQLPSSKPQTGLLYFSKATSRAPPFRAQLEEVVVKGAESIATLVLPLVSGSQRVLGHSCSFQTFSFLLSLFKNTALN